MRNLRITLSRLAALHIAILAALFTGQTASAATPFKSGVYSYEDIGETGTVSVAFNEKGEIWFHAFVINEDGHTAELTPEGGKWIPMKGNTFSYNIKSDHWDYTLTGKFYPEDELEAPPSAWGLDWPPNTATKALPTLTAKATCSTSWTRRQPLSWQRADGIQE